MFAFSIIPFIYMAFLQRKKFRDRNQIIVCQGLGLQLEGISGLDSAEKVYFTICELYLIFLIMKKCGDC